MKKWLTLIALLLLTLIAVAVPFWWPEQQESGTATSQEPDTTLSSALAVIDSLEDTLTSQNELIAELYREINELKARIAPPEPVGTSSPNTSDSLTPCNPNIQERGDCISKGDGKVIVYGLHDENMEAFRAVIKNGIKKGICARKDINYGICIVSQNLDLPSRIEHFKSSGGSKGLFFSLSSSTGAETILRLARVNMPNVGSIDVTIQQGASYLGDAEVNKIFQLISK